MGHGAEGHLEDVVQDERNSLCGAQPLKHDQQGEPHAVIEGGTVRGIGKWSAEIFLMFQLRRLDVWPTGDLGVRKGYGLAWQIPTPTPKQLDLLGEPYHPYRTLVAWYCWRATQLYAGAASTAVTS